MVPSTVETPTGLTDDQLLPILTVANLGATCRSLPVEGFTFQVTLLNSPRLPLPEHSSQTPGSCRVPLNGGLHPRRLTALRVNE